MAESMVLCEKVKGAGYPLGRASQRHSDAGSERIFPQTRKQATQMGCVLRGHGINLHAKASTIFSDMADFRLSANLAFLHQKVQAHQLTFFFARPGLKEEAGGTEIAHLGDVPVRRRFPVDPNVFNGWYARRPPAGGAGNWKRSTHRVHPVTAKLKDPVGGKARNRRNRPRVSQST